MSDHAELRRLAEAATPGPWEADGKDIYLGVTERPDPDDEDNFTQWLSRGQIYDEGGHTEADAAFIAAANPATVLTLLDEIDALKGAAAERDEDGT